MFNANKVRIIQLNFTSHSIDLTNNHSHKFIFYLITLNY